MCCALPLLKTLLVDVIVSTKDRLHIHVEAASAVRMALRAAKGAAYQVVQVVFLFACAVHTRIAHQFCRAAHALMMEAARFGPVEHVVERLEPR